MSLLGKPLPSPPLATEERKRRQDEVEKARRVFESDPASADAALTLADRLADLGEYREAIRLLSDAMQRHPDDARLFLDRGHRFINVRRFQDALNDLQSAELLERAKPDPALRQQIYYHIGLAQFLLGKYDRALDAYRRSLPLATTPDRLVATSDWMYMSLRRLGRAQEAEKVLEPISIDLNVHDAIAHHKLLLMYSGDIAPEELVRQDANTTDGTTILYGIGDWYVINGQPERAAPLWKKILDGNQSFSFGYVAAEAEVARASEKRTSASFAAPWTRDSELRYRTLFEQNAAGVCVTKLDGEIVDCNATFASMLRYERPELIGNKIALLYERLLIAIARPRPQLPRLPPARSDIFR